MWNDKKENDINFYDDNYISGKIIIGKTKKEKNVNDNKKLDKYSFDRLKGKEGQV